jgi:hypothetical protein
LLLLLLLLLLQELPSTVRHVVLGTTVPIVYPHLKGGEAILGTLGKLNKNSFMRKVGAAGGRGGVGRCCAASEWGAPSSPGECTRL